MIKIHTRNCLSYEARKPRCSATAIDTGEFDIQLYQPTIIDNPISYFVNCLVCFDLLTANWGSGPILGTLCLTPWDTRAGRTCATGKRARTLQEIRF